jgi:hypothetical protein
VHAAVHGQEGDVLVNVAVREQAGRENLAGNVPFTEWCALVAGERLARAAAFRRASGLGC